MTTAMRATALWLAGMMAAWPQRPWYIPAASDTSAPPPITTLPIEERSPHPCLAVSFVCARNLVGSCAAEASAELAQGAETRRSDVAG